MVAPLPALRMPQSTAEGAASGLHNVVQRVGGVTPAGCQPVQHPSIFDPFLNLHVVVCVFTSSVSPRLKGPCLMENIVKPATLQSYHSEMNWQISEMAGC